MVVVAYFGRYYGVNNEPDICSEVDRRSDALYHDSPSMCADQIIQFVSNNPMFAWMYIQMVEFIRFLISNYFKFICDI